MLEKLASLLRQKKSKAFYSEKLGISIEEVEELLKELKEKGTKESETDLSIEGETQKYNLEKGTFEISVYYDHAPTPEEVIKDHKIQSNWKLSAYYSKARPKGWLVTALFKNITKEEEEIDKFQEFLKTYKSSHNIKDFPRTVYNRDLARGSLVINKQDSHLNKKDEDGDNSIEKRFKEYENSLLSTLEKSSLLVNLDKVVYIIGSDQFNSEWTGATVKGTEQTNILDYTTSFQKICDHEVSVITKILTYTDCINIIYLGGNHDFNVSFHLVSWLKAYFRSDNRISIDIRNEYTKYFSLYDSSFGINHGDVQKPERLVQNYPLEYKKGFYEANFHYFLTGDKHTEMSKDIGGVKFYQIRALSKAKSSWDKQNGYTTTPAQMTSFLVEEGEGVTNVINKIIK